RSAMIARGSGAGRRIGYSGQWFSPLFYTDRVERCFYEFQEIERLLRLLEPLSLAPEHVSDWPELVLPVDARERAEEFFAANFSGPVLGMHPGSVWGTKRWPVEYFAETGARALSAGAQVVLFAGPGEEDMACRAEALMREKLGESVAGRIKNLSGALSLVDLAAYIGRLNCYLTNDSGPMHMAWSQRVPVVALFGPTVRKLGFAPRGKDSIMMEATNLDCRPCGLHGPQSCPRGHHHCMTLLTPELVWPEVASRLGV
ncbi:glycosyltransferase family 9 protein, partial [Desulfovibrio sp. OttesenSCG-928-C06]|nr:glycosyltransferase family 9 protein [Desulfovibrio sp. OttesenSCG-928-C06]